MEACRRRKSGEFRNRLNPRRRTADHRDGGRDGMAGWENADLHMSTRARRDIEAKIVGLRREIDFARGGTRFVSNQSAVPWPSPCPWERADAIGSKTKTSGAARRPGGARAIVHSRARPLHETGDRLGFGAVGNTDGSA